MSSMEITQMLNGTAFGVSRSSRDIFRILPLLAVAVFAGIFLILYALFERSYQDDFVFIGKTSLYIAIYIMMIVFVLYSLLAQKILSPLATIAANIQRLKFMPISGWRQLKQYQDSHYLNDFIVSLNELIFHAQRSLVCQENLGRFLAHEIKTPLTNLMNELEMARESLPDLTSAAGEGFYQHAMNDVMRIRSIINNICELAFIENGDHGEQEVDLGVLISDSVNEFQNIYKATVLFENKIEGDMVPTRVNPDYFWVLCSNILRNSLKHGNGHKLPPKIKLQRVNHQYKLEFSDQGPGFPFSKEQFDQLISGNNNEQLLKLHGVGLVLCLKLSEIMNIAVDFENQPSRGAVVNVWLDYARK